MNTKPDKINAIAIIMIVSGALNIIAGFAVTLTLVITILGILCIPLGLIPIGIGIYEIIQGANILNDKPVKNVMLVGWLEIASVLWANIISLVAGILVLVFYNEEDVKAYFDGVALDIVTPAE
ncbi:MAG: hypothetical protein ABFS17_02850 [Chloroflexota bacterium]